MPRRKLPDGQALEVSLTVRLTKAEREGLEELAQRIERERSLPEGTVSLGMAVRILVTEALRKKPKR